MESIALNLISLMRNIKDDKKKFFMSINRVLNEWAFMEENR